MSQTTLHHVCQRAASFFMLTGMQRLSHVSLAGLLSCTVLHHTAAAGLESVGHGCSVVSASVHGSLVRLSLPATLGSLAKLCTRIAQLPTLQLRPSMLLCNKYLDGLREPFRPEPRVLLSAGQAHEQAVAHPHL